MKALHTPAPWTYGVRTDGSIWLSIGDHKTGPHHQGDIVATPADARLICAATNLLAVAQKIKAHGTISSTWYDELEAAIIKATGSTE